jgi:4-amino-4-deoxy-L-arabinose transferase-like glycosyltransferase
MVLSGLGLIVVTYRLACLLFNPAVASLSALLLAASAPLIYFTKTVNLDLPNAFLSTLSVYLYNLGKKNRSFVILTGIILGLGMLCRSFLSLFPIIVILTDTLLSGNRKISIVWFMRILVIACIIALPWHISAYLTAPAAFIKGYIDLPLTYHLNGPIPGEAPTSPWYYLRIITLFPPAVFAALLFTEIRNVKPGTVYVQLWSWIITILLVVTFAKTRHEWYILPIYPPIAVLSAVFLIERVKIHKTGLVSFLFRLVTCTLILAPPIGLFINPLPEAGITRAVRTIEAASAKNEIIYELNYPFVPVVRNYPHRPVSIITEKDISLIIPEREKIFLIYGNADIPVLPKTVSPKILFKNENYAAVEIQTN